MKPTKYYETQIYAALRVDMLGTHAAHVMHLLGWEVKERLRKATDNAESAASMLMLMTDEQRAEWAAGKIYAAADKAAAEAARLETQKEEWSSMTDEQRAAATEKYISDVSDMSRSVGWETPTEIEEKQGHKFFYRKAAHAKIYRRSARGRKTY